MTLARKPRHLELSVATGYKTLISKISRELSDLELFIKRRVVQGYWSIGKYIDDHILTHKERAKYGAMLLERLAKDINCDRSTLQRSLQFYRIYPIRAERHKLTWEHYKSLITIKDGKERKKIEEKVIRDDWNSTRLREYLSTKRELTRSEKDDKPIPQLTFTRGKLHTYQIVKPNKPLAEKNPLALDLGFRLQYLLPKNTARLKEGDIAELIFKNSELAGTQKSEVPKDEIFTYQAHVDKVIDGDTLLVTFDFGLDFSVSQKLRLRGIDCQEMDTEEGKRVKRFVESRLKDCEFIIVKTYKDRSDKFDRYLADVFYETGTHDPLLAASEGKFLNQELLDERLAVKYD